MSKLRGVFSVTKSRPTREGAGVELRRAFGGADERLDPFLLLDDFGSENPDDYLKGFPWHPHRGIETITYLLDGEVAHGDSLGNKGVIGPGDVQWMTAGSGIIHEEMPRSSSRLHGFQLWSNLPATNKMRPPRYQDVPAASIPTAKLAEGVNAKVICGRIAGVEGPVRDIVTDPLYADIDLEPGCWLQLPIEAGHNVFAYVIEGRASFSGGVATVDGHHLVIFGEGEHIEVETKEEGARFLLVAGKPIGEPVAWAGPIVMNTREELRQAFREYEEGTFLKHEKK